MPSGMPGAEGCDPLSDRARCWRAAETAAARRAVFQRALLASELFPNPRGPETCAGELGPLSAPSSGTGGTESEARAGDGAGGIGARRENARLKPSPTDLLLFTALFSGSFKVCEAEDLGASIAENEELARFGLMSVFNRNEACPILLVEGRGGKSVSNLDSADTRSFWIRDAVFGRITA